MPRTVEKLLVQGDERWSCATKIFQFQVEYKKLATVFNRDDDNIQVDCH